MPWDNQSGGPWGSGSKPPDLEEFLRRSQGMLGGFLPGNLGGRGIALIALAAIALWGFSGFFRVEPDELGVVLRFGKTEWRVNDATALSRSSQCFQELNLVPGQVAGH